MFSCRFLESVVERANTKKTENTAMDIRRLDKETLPMKRVSRELEAEEENAIEEACVKQIAIG